MGSLFEELEAREAAVRARAEELQRQIAELTRQLEVEEERLSRLRITRETVREILGGPQQAAAAGDEPEPAGQEPVMRPSGGPVIGVMTVPPWRPGMDISVLPRAYQDLLEVLADAGRPLRAKQIAPLVGLPEDASKIEGLRSKLKRLVVRGWLVEDVPGLFAARMRVDAEDASGPGW
jgi:hypothetical protein